MSVERHSWHLGATMHLRAQRWEGRQGLTVLCVCVCVYVCVCRTVVVVLVSPHVIHLRLMCEGVKGPEGLERARRHVLQLPVRGQDTRTEGLGATLLPHSTELDCVPVHLGKMPHLHAHTHAHA